MWGMQENGEIRCGYVFLEFSVSGLKHMDKVAREAFF